MALQKRCQVIRVLIISGLAVFPQAVALGQQSQPNTDASSLSNHGSQQTAWDKIHVLEKEREGLRAEMVALQNMMPTILLGFLAALASILGFFSRDKEKWSESVLRNFPIVMAHVVFLLGLISLLTMCNLSMHGGYIRAVEMKINSLAGESLNLWESKIAARYVLTPNGAFFWTALVALGVGISLFIVLLVKPIKSRFWRSTILAETFVILLLFLFACIDASRVATEAQLLFGIPLPV